MRLEFIPIWDIEDRWSDVSKHFEMALARQKSMNLESVYQDCKRGKFHVWHIEGKASVLTEIQQFPLERICMIVLCGGEGMSEWIDMTVETLSRYAKSYGCTSLMVVGRKGWSSIPGFNIEDVVMRKTI